MESRNKKVGSSQGHECRVPLREEAQASSHPCIWQLLRKIKDYGGVLAGSFVYSVRGARKETYDKEGVWLHWRLNLKTKKRIFSL